MFFEPKDTSIVKTNALENSIAVKQTMIEHRNLRVRFRVKFSVDINLRFLDTGCGAARTAFYRGFNYCISTRLVNFRFIQHRHISRFHNRNKSAGVYLRNSSYKMKVA